MKLGQGVGAARVGWVILAGREGRVRDMDTGRRGEDEGRDRHAAAEIQQADRAEDVGEWLVNGCLTFRQTAGNYPHENRHPQVTVETRHRAFGGQGATADQKPD